MNIAWPLEGDFYAGDSRGPVKQTKIAKENTCTSTAQ